MRLCVDVGTEQVKWGLFEGDKLVKAARIQNLAELKPLIESAPIEAGMLVCNNPMKAEETVRLLESWKIPIQSIKLENFLARTTPESKDLLLPDTIAKIYAALSHHPTHDCLIVDFGTTVRYEFISKQGHLIGRSIFPFFDLLYQALNRDPLKLEDLLPPPLGLNPVDSMMSGCYYGLLGSVERIVSEIRSQFSSSSEIITLATGTLTENPCWKNPLSELVDFIYPFLTLEGLNQIINEGHKP